MRTVEFEFERRRGFRREGGKEQFDYAGANGVDGKFGHLLFETLFESKRNESCFQFFKHTVLEWNEFLDM